MMVTKRHYVSIIIKSVTCILVVFVSGELFLRYRYGFCNAPLYSSDKDFEYMLVANQDGMRLGNHFHTNSYRQRSEEPDTTKVKVLGLGDSVLFGGTYVGNGETAPYLFGRITGMQMLNISAGSWGPDNCVAYLYRYGMFDAKAMWLLVSSHDAHDNMNFQPVVDNHPSYPSRNYRLAWCELIFRYVIPRAKVFVGCDNKGRMNPDEQVVAAIDKRERRNGKPFNTGFDGLKAIADSLHIPLYVCLHAEKNELEAGQYNEQGQEIIQWCETHDVKIILDIEEGLTAEMFHDVIHLNVEGNRFMAELMSKYIVVE